MKIRHTAFLALAFILAPWGQKGTAVAAEPSSAGGRAHTPQAMEAGPRTHESYGDVVLRHAGDLNLSDEQSANIMRIHRNNQQRIGELGGKLRETRQLAYTLFLNPGSDEAAIRQAAKDHTAVFDELVETALKSRAAINAVLNPEQLKLLKSYKAEP